MRLAPIAVPLCVMLVLCGVCCVRAGAEAAADLAAGPGHARHAQWLPRESWAGGKHYDPRLDATVRFWAAGIPLRDVFEEIGRQTGVEIGFWPPGDMNERVCVNLFLNPDEPPTLREVMVQLSWATDCAFGRAVSGEVITYRLLSTSIGRGVEERLEKEMEARARSREQEDEKKWAAMREQWPARLAEFQRGLALSRQEAIEAYRGRDDVMLLALLDPKQSAIGRFALGLSEADIGRLAAGETITRQWSELTAEQRAWLTRAVYASPVVARGTHEAALEWSDRDWFASTQPAIMIGLSGGDLRAEAIAQDEEGGEAARYVPVIPQLNLVPDPTRAELGAHPWLQERLALALSTPLTDEEEERLRQDYQKRESRVGRKRHVEERLEEQRPHLGDAEALLASMTLPVQADEAYTLWQIQEAAAALSGVHVVSDCFWQPPRSLDFLLAALYPEGIPELTALDVLRLSCLASHWLPSPEDPYSVGWEWGQAGRFLHFRSIRRDLFRAAFLPTELVAAIESWIGPSLVPDPETGEYPAEVEINVDLRQCAGVAAQLQDSHWKWGCGMIYEDPTDERNAYLQAFREPMLRFPLSPYLGIEALHGLSEDEWQRLQGDGMLWSADTFAWSHRVAQWWAYKHSCFDVEEEVLVRLVKIEPEEVWWPGADPHPGCVPVDRDMWGGWHRLWIVGDEAFQRIIDVEGMGGLGDFPTIVRVRPDERERLVEHPE